MIKNVFYILIKEKNLGIVKLSLNFLLQSEQKIHFVNTKDKI